MLGWEKPLLRFDEERGKSRKASWLELFYDVFFVVAIGQLAHELGANLSPAGYGVYLVQFIPLFILWLGFVYYTERFETDGLDHQLATFAMMFCVTGMAVFAHHGLTQNYGAYISFYVAGRAFTLALWIRAALHNRDTFGVIAHNVIAPPAAGIVLTMLSTLVEGYPRFILLALGLMIEVAFPLLLRNQIDRLPRVSISKTHERLGLFTIIVLGETVVGIVAGLTTLDHPTTTDFSRAAKALAIGCYFWWVYYGSLPHREFKQSPRGIVLWAYLHLPIFVAISGVSPAISTALTVTGDGLPLKFRLILAFSLAVFLVSVALIELLVYNTEARSRGDLADALLKMVSAVGVLLVALIPFSANALLLSMSAPLLLSPLYRGYSRSRRADGNRA